MNQETNKPLNEIEALKQKTVRLPIENLKYGLIVDKTLIGCNPDDLNKLMETFAPDLVDSLSDGFTAVVWVNPFPGSVGPHCGNPHGPQPNMGGFNPNMGLPPYGFTGGAYVGSPPHRPSGTIGIFPYGKDGIMIGPIGIEFMVSPEVVFTNIVQLIMRHIRLHDGTGFGFR